MESLIEGAWLEDQLGRHDLCILDCSVTPLIHEGGGFELQSGRAAWEQGHIPGSQHVDLLQDLSDRNSSIPLMMPPMEQLRDVLQAAGVADGCQVVVYDNNLHMWAARVWWMLKAVSIDASLLNGGWQAWTQENRRVETGDDRPVTRGALTLTPRSGSFVDKDEVLRQIDVPSTCLIDTLQPEVFRGEQQDYQRAGHIPGAQNVPFAHLVDPETHRYLPVPKLREQFAGTGINDADRVITYCGGGVSAASAAFVLGLLGFENVAIYDGSLLEWTADPSLPLVAGAG